MADVIHLLPENVANQIAAGEVVQRPASVVKELLENAIDAGATQIKLIVKEAGKSLIQVTDNGCGMSETDARMCFERHATSKIHDARDLFAIKTMGFRGEAMASIAAVAQVELRTRRATDELGVRVVVENSVLSAHEPCQCAPGTSIAVKNLFFSVPARKNFLKSDQIELKHVMDEFQRVAMAHPDVFFSMHVNDQEIFHLPVGNLRQRIVKIFGEAVNKKLVPVQEETDALRINGFVGKPDYSKKTRGEQLFFVNRRFIKSSYLHHAVVSAYDDLLPEDAYPLYVLFLEVDPARIDINVHPTKQEIKFDDEKLIYNVLKVTVRHALGSHNITPTLDFEQEAAFNPTPAKMPALPRRESATERESGGGFSRSPDRRDQDNLRHWQRLYEGLDAQKAIESAPLFESTPSETQTDEAAANTPFSNMEMAVGDVEIMALDDADGTFTKVRKEPYQIHGQYILNQIKSGFFLIDQQAAGERILYERFLEAMRERPAAVQSMLFPATVSLSTADATLLRDILPEVNRLGFDIAEFGGTDFVVHGVPAELAGRYAEKELIEKLLTQYKENLDFDLGIEDNLARAMARSAAIKRGQILSVPEMQELIDQLFACSVPYKSPSGKNCFITIELEELQKRFGA